jgi:hypothetical protein
MNKWLTGIGIGIGGIVGGIIGWFVGRSKVEELEIERDNLELENRVLRSNNEMKEQAIDNMDSMNRLLINLMKNLTDEDEKEDEEEA